MGWTPCNLVNRSPRNVGITRHIPEDSNLCIHNNGNSTFQAQYCTPTKNALLTSMSPPELTYFSVPPAQGIVGWAGNVNVSKAGRVHLELS
jgi:hypothetical protein